MKSFLKKSALKETIAGLIVLICFVSLFVFVYNRKQIKPEATNFQLYARFNKVDGIKEGAIVQLSGIPVGYVTDMVLDPFYRVILTLSFNKPMNLPTDTAALIETNGLVGAKFIELVPGGEEENLKNGGNALFAHQGFSMSFFSSMLDIPYPLFSTHFDIGHTGMCVVNFEEQDGYVYPRVLQYANDSHLYREGILTGYHNQIRF